MNRLLIGIVAALVMTMVATLLVTMGTSDDVLNLGLRATARSSLSLFLLAFSASSLNQLWTTSASKWLLRNRRSLGVAFALSHFVHFGLIAARALGHPEAFWVRTPASLIPGGIAYVLIVAMTITSFDGPARWLGRARWKILHKLGVYVVWAIFAGAYAGRVRTDAWAWVPAGLLLAALGARIAARIGAWRRR